jgi:flagellar basal body rod protein FlgC
MPSFSIPLTGLESDNTALNTIANNLANMSTTGFKAQTTDFGNLFFQQVGENGAGNPIQIGTGVGVAATETDFSSGPVTATTNENDVALNGNGYFAIDNAGQLHCLEQRPDVDRRGRPGDGVSGDERGSQQQCHLVTDHAADRSDRRTAGDVDPLADGQSRGRLRARDGGAGHPPGL